MTFHEYLARARQYDAQRAGERDRLLQEARQAHTALRRRTGPASRARRLARLIFRRAPHKSLGPACKGQQNGRGPASPTHPATLAKLSPSAGPARVSLERRADFAAMRRGGKQAP